METRLAHPVFDAVRPWLERVGLSPSHARLNALAEERNLATENGRPVRFVPPGPADPYYEVHLYETGQVQTRPGSLHDVFNALAWLAFPKTKARINAMHAAEIPKEGGKRGRLRDLLTIFDEGGAIVAGTPVVEVLVREARWRELFVGHAREFRIVMVGHALMEQALAPHLGLTSKVLFADPAQELDVQAAQWLATRGRTPRDLPPLPVMGYPGWYPGSGKPALYDDTRYFRPPPPPRNRAAGERQAESRMPSGVGQAVAVSQDAEESPGSIERDAG